MKSSDVVAETNCLDPGFRRDDGGARREQRIVCKAIRRTGAIIAIVLLVWASDVGARGGGGRGGGGGGGARGGGGFNRGGPAAWGLLNQYRYAGGQDRGVYDARGPAADGNLGLQHPDREERQDQRQERREERRQQGDAVWDDGEQDIGERREAWNEYVEDHRDDGDDGDYYDDVYATVPCNPNTVALQGIIYYVCGTTWYTRAYGGGDIVYVAVPNPTGH